MEETQSPMLISLLRFTVSGSSGGIGVAADLHPQQIRTHLGTISSPPAWLCLFCILSVILAVAGLGKEAY